MSIKPVMSMFANELDCLRARDKWHYDRITELEARLAAAAKPDWICVEDALPVVPDGEKGVDIAVVDDDGDVIRTYWPARKTCFIGRYSHWKYDPQPQPPEGIK